MEISFEVEEIRQMVLPLLTIVFAILAILFFIYYGAGIAFYTTAIIGIVIGFYVARLASSERSHVSRPEAKAVSGKTKRVKNK